MDTPQITKIADLAKLQVADAANLNRDLDKILHFVNQINRVNTEGLAPLAHPFEITQRLRADSVTCDDEAKARLANAPQAAQQLFIVPKVVEQ